MKKIYCLLVLCILPILSFAQLTLGGIPLKNEMSYVFESNNSAEQKIKNTKTWIATTFGDYNSVLQFEDITTGRIIIKGKTALKESYYDVAKDLDVKSLGINIDFYSASQYTFTMIFDVKDDKFRIKIENIKYLHDISFGEHAKRVLTPDTESTLEDRFISIETTTNKNIANKKAKAQAIQDKLDKGVRKRKEREALISRYLRLTDEIEKLEANKDAEILKSKEEIVLEYQSTFYDLLNSASLKISETDDF